jgi:hypothetical protein
MAMKEQLTWLLCLMAMVACVQAQTIYNCKGLDGSVTYANTACAGEAVNIVVPQHRISDSQQQQPVNDPYSVVEQARRIDERKRIEQARKTIEKIGKRLSTRDAISDAPPPVLTYLQARDRATRDAGYQRYGQLTASQKERVHAEMTKYRFLPRQKRPAATGGDAPEKPIINAQTGEMLTPSGGGYVGTRDGAYYTPAGKHGVINTRTNEFLPVH